MSRHLPFPMPSSCTSRVTARLSSHFPLTESADGGRGRPRMKAAATPLLFFDTPQFQEAAMAKPATVKIKLVSSADTGFFYVTKKNPRNITERSEEHTSELQSLMRISYAVFCLKKKTTQ